MRVRALWRQAVLCSRANKLLGHPRGRTDIATELPDTGQRRFPQREIVLPCGMKLLRCLFLALAFVSSAQAADAPAGKTVLSVEQAQEHLAAGIQLLDVRTLEEWNEAHLKGATRIDVQQDGFLEKAKAQLMADKPLLVYCRSGKRSATAAQQLRAAGFTHVLELSGGIIAWQAANKPVEK